MGNSFGKKLSEIVKNTFKIKKGSNSDIKYTIDTTIKDILVTKGNVLQVCCYKFKSESDDKFKLGFAVGKHIDLGVLTFDPSILFDEFGRFISSDLGSNSAYDLFALGSKELSLIHI